MHDWWLALIAAAFGAIGFIDTPTVLYRQHATNVIGSRSYFKKIKHFFKDPRRRIQYPIDQARALLAIKRDMPSRKKNMIQTYINILNAPRIDRLKFLINPHTPISLMKKLIVMGLILFY
jgi:rhamnosyltransferase